MSEPSFSSSASRNVTDARAIVARLDAQPPLPELLAALADFRIWSDENLNTSPSALGLEVFATIFSRSLIPLFGNDTAALHAFVTVFSSPHGLSTLMARLAIASQHEMATLLRVLEGVLAVPSLVTRLTRSNRKTALSLLFGSRILTVVASKLTNSWAGDAHRYTAWLAREIAASELATDAVLFDRTAKLGAPTVLIETYLSDPQYFKALHKLWPLLRRTQQQFVLARGLLPNLPASPAQAGRLLLDLDIEADLVYSACLRTSADTMTLRAAVVHAREAGALPALVTSLVREWASKIAMECSPLAEKQTLTQLLLASCCSLTQADAARVSHSPELLEGVSLHLSSTSPNVRKLGTLVAETFAKQAGEKLTFGITYDDYEWWLGFDTVDDTWRPPTEYLQSILQPNGSNTKSADSGNELSEGRASADDGDDDIGDKNGNDDEDDEESDEEVPPPFYIKDLVSYLQSDKYSEVHSGLTTGARLISRKSEFGSEVAQYAPDLLRVTCALTDKFSITRFAQLRQSLLNAVVTADPQQAPAVTRMFATGDWSLAQRQSLLTALAHGAHALADGFTSAAFESLPPALHRLFFSQEDKSRFGIESIAKLVVSEAPEDGHVVRRSKKLQRQHQETSHSKKNQFSRVSHLFFFPLIAAVPPLRASSYDALIYAQWLRTLGVIVVEAYPTHHMPDMVGELWPVLRQLILREVRDIVIEEALYTCLLMLVTVAGGVIIQEYAVDIGLLLDRIAIRIRESSELQTQQLAATAAAKLAEMAGVLEQRMLAST